jgi:hypothetical protein
MCLRIILLVDVLEVPNFQREERYLGMDSWIQTKLIKSRNYLAKEEIRFTLYLPVL